MSDEEERIADLERRVQRLERVVTQLVAEARSRQSTGASTSEHPQDRRVITEKMTFDWQGGSSRQE